MTRNINRLLIGLKGLKINARHILGGEYNDKP